MVVCVVVVVIAVGIGKLGPWDGVEPALALGLAAAVAAPLGDLCQSLVKRDLGVKDMGSMLPGHGGIFDRFDALLFVLPDGLLHRDHRRPPDLTRAPVTTTVALAGSTGSIGTQALDVVRAEPEPYRVVALGASGRNVEHCVRQAREVRPGGRRRRRRPPSRRAEGPPARPVSCASERTGLASLGGEADVCVNGVVGFAGLSVTLATLRAGRRLALANKESLIAARAGGAAWRGARPAPSSCRSTASTARSTSACAPGIPPARRGSHSWC